MGGQEDELHVLVLQHQIGFAVLIGIEFADLGARPGGWWDLEPASRGGLGRRAEDRDFLDADQHIANEGEADRLGLQVEVFGRQLESAILGRRPEAARFTDILPTAEAIDGDGHLLKLVLHVMSEDIDLHAGDLVHARERDVEHDRAASEDDALAG